MGVDPRAVVDQYVASRWMNRTLDQSDRVFIWVAMLDGSIVFSRGGGMEPGHFNGHQLGRDYGTNSEFFAAVGRLVKGTASDLLEMSVGGDDNPRYAGVPFLNCYTLIRSGGGVPVAVAVTSIRLEGMSTFGQQCPFREGGACRA